MSSLCRRSFVHLGLDVGHRPASVVAIEQDSPGHPLNQGVVVFHAGANVARRWNDFRQFSAADQAYFAELLPEAEEVEFAGDTVAREPGGGGGIAPVEILEERGVRAADMEPIGDPHAEALLRQLADLGITPDQAAQELRQLRTNRQDVREARRAALNERVQNECGGILGRLNIRPGGRTLDPRRRERNFAWVTAELNRRINERVGGRNAKRGYEITGSRRRPTLYRWNTCSKACLW